jgi:dihydroorotate dehydrogenase
MTLAQETPLIEFLAAGSVDGIIISNTTTDRSTIAGDRYAAEAGGLSGTPLRALSTAMLQRAYALTRGKVLLIGCGGIGSGLDAYEKLCAGADLLQIYSAFIYQGPLVLRKILLELNALLKRDGVKNIREIIGTKSKFPHGGY